MKLSKGPWWNNAKGSFFATFNKRKIDLHTADKAEARRFWHRMMADPSTIPAPRVRRSDPSPVPIPFDSEPTVSEIIDRYLAFQRPRIVESSLRCETDRAAPLREAFGATTAQELSSEAFGQWIEGRKRWGQTRRANVGLFARKLFAWAVKKDIIDRSPLKDYEPSRPLSRGAEAVIAPEELERFLAGAGSAVSDIVRFLFSTGARPGEAVIITAAEGDIDNRVVTLTRHKTARKTGRARLIPLNAEALEIVSRLMKLRPSGPIFLSEQGERWTTSNLARRIKVVSRRTKVVLTGYAGRHTAATHMLENGVPDSIVAGALGHGSTAMVSKHYGHVGQRAKALIAAVDTLSNLI